MRTVLISLGLLLIGAGMFVALALSRDMIDPYLVSLGLDPDSETTIRMVIKPIAIVMIGAPLTMLLYAVFALGSDKSDTDIHGYRVLRLRAGARIALPLLCFALVAVFIAGANEFLGEANRIGTAFCAVFGLLFLWGGPWVMSATIRFDGSTVSDRDLLFRLRRHEWRDLDKIVPLPERNEIHLKFRTGKKVRVSTFYAGVDEILGLARSKLSHA